jgi:hypothetical protein
MPLYSQYNGKKPNSSSYKSDEEITKEFAEKTFYLSDVYDQSKIRVQIIIGERIKDPINPFGYKYNITLGEGGPSIPVTFKNHMGKYSVYKDTNEPGQTGYMGALVLETPVAGEGSAKGGRRKTKRNKYNKRKHGNNKRKYRKSRRVA